jgi:FkbM family methyltransferase
MDVGNRFWRALSPVAARVIRLALRARWVPRDLKAMLWRQAERRVSHYGQKSRARTRCGHVLDVDIGRMVEKQIYYFGEWEPFLSRYLLDHRPWKGDFIDIGANIGYFSLLACDVFDRIVAIEASPSIFQRLQGNVAANHAHARIALHNVAVGESKGELDFYFDPEQCGGSSLLPGGNRVFEARVPVLPLCEILTPQDIRRAAFIKIDVEGLEGAVLDQILAMQGDLRPDLRIMVEYGQERGIDESVCRLRDAGFDMRLMQGPYDLREYLDPCARSALARLDELPAVFSDILFERRR